MVTKSFASDNYSGAHPSILKAVSDANVGHAKSYGYDEITKRADEKFSEHFGDGIEVYYVFNGTAANVIGLAGITPSHSSIICTDVGHINVDECAAPQRFIGCRILTIPTADGKMTVDGIKKHVKRIGDHHYAQAKVVSLTQSTEYGTVYTVEEIKEIVDFAHENNLYFHMDGARLANAAASLNVSLKELTADLNVDVLSFGGTKNGIMFGDAIVFFKKEYAKDFMYIRKQGMQLASKMRYISAQFEALLSNDLWLKNARHANKMAKLLESKLRNIPKVKITQKVEANAVFAIIPKEHVAELQSKYQFTIWEENTSEARLMTSFDTTEEDVEGFTKVIAETLK